MHRYLLCDRDSVPPTDDVPERGLRNGVVDPLPLLDGDTVSAANGSLPLCLPLLDTEYAKLPALLPSEKRGDGVTPPIVDGDCRSEPLTCPAAESTKELVGLCDEDLSNRERSPPDKRAD